jgi:hypothetical protein
MLVEKACLEMSTERFSNEWPEGNHLRFTGLTSNESKKKYLKGLIRLNLPLVKIGTSPNGLKLKQEVVFSSI